MSLFNLLSLELVKTKTEPNFNPKLIDSVNENTKIYKCCKKKWSFLLIALITACFFPTLVLWINFNLLQTLQLKKYSCLDPNRDLYRDPNRDMPGSRPGIPYFYPGGVLPGSRSGFCLDQKPGFCHRDLPGSRPGIPYFYPAGIPAESWSGFRWDPGGIPAHIFTWETV